MPAAGFVRSAGEMEGKTVLNSERLRIAQRLFEAARVGQAGVIETDPEYAKLREKAPVGLDSEQGAQTNLTVIE